MRKSIEGCYHWISVGCMAGAVGMICAGHTVWEPFLQSRGDLVPLIYWSACAAFGVATVGFSYLALATAQRHLHELEDRRNQVAPPPSAARFSLVKK
jgi:hypothetical protein